MRRYLVSACLIAGVATTLCACDPKAEPAVPIAPAAPATPAAPVPPTGVSITSPVVGASVGSPLVVTGAAPADWYFEAQFDAQLLAADGTVLAEAPARAQGDDWMSKASVPFTTSLSYVSATAQAGTVVLTEDQTGEDLPPPRTVRLAVVLRPAS